MFCKYILNDGNALTHIRSATVSSDRLLPGIHGLRGIAAMAVVLFHIVEIAKIMVPGIFSFIATDFSKGVQLFFVISAFSLMHSTEKTLVRKTWATEYFVKRFFRIAPFYYFVMIAMILGSAAKWGKVTVGVQAFLLNLTFMFGFAPWTSIVMAGWTVGVEMLFYAVFPVLLLTIRTTSATFVLVIISIIVTISARSVLNVHFENQVALYGYNWAEFSFAANLCYFAMGLFAFRLAASIDRASLIVRWLIPLFAVILLGSLLIGSGGSYSWNWKKESILWGIGFTGLCIWQSIHPSRWSANRIFEYLGERSYSIYLLHPIVIVVLVNPLQSLYLTLTPYVGAYAYFFCAFFVLTLLLLLSELTYRFIEVPGIRLGKKISNRLKIQEIQ